MSFCTVINCMDGRVQIPVLRYLQKRFDVMYVDSITEPGPVRLFASPMTEASAGDEELRLSVLSRIAISVEKHGSKKMALVAHDLCAGNPLSKSEQVEQLHRSVRALRERFPHLEVIALWLASDWQVVELDVP